MVGLRLYPSTLVLDNGYSTVEQCQPVRNRSAARGLCWLCVANSPPLEMWNRVLDVSHKVAATFLIGSTAYYGAFVASAYMELRVSACVGVRRAARICGQSAKRLLTSSGLHKSSMNFSLSSRSGLRGRSSWRFRRANELDFGLRIASGLGRKVLCFLE